MMCANEARAIARQALESTLALIERKVAEAAGKGSCKTAIIVEPPLRGALADDLALAGYIVSMPTWQRDVIELSWKEEQ